MLPPARPLIPVASGGPLGLGCEGDLWFSAGRCRLGCSLDPRLSRIGFSGGSGETAAAGTVERGGVLAIASGGKAAEGATMDVPAAVAAQVAQPKWGVFLGNIDRRN